MTDETYMEYWARAQRVAYARLAFCGVACTGTGMLAAFTAGHLNAALIVRPGNRSWRLGRPLVLVSDVRRHADSRSPRVPDGVSRRTQRLVAVVNIAEMTASINVIAAERDKWRSHDTPLRRGSGIVDSLNTALTEAKAKLGDKLAEALA